MNNKGEFINRSPQVYKDGTIVLLKTSTDTIKLLNPNADALMLGDATHEGGNIKVYRDGSGNLQLLVDADAASNAKALDVYGGVLCQNYLTVGRTTLETGYDLYVEGDSRITAGQTASKFRASSTEGFYGDNNLSNLPLNLPITSGSSTHQINIQIDSNDIVVAQATGDGAGSITNKAIGLYGTTPTTQAAAISDPAESTAGNNAAIDSILAALRGIGLIAT